MSPQKRCYWDGRCGRGTVKGLLQLQVYGYEDAEKFASAVEKQYQ